MRFELGISKCAGASCTIAGFRRGDFLALVAGHSIVAVMRTLLGSDFCGQKSTTMPTYVGVTFRAHVCNLCVVHHKDAVLSFDLCLVIPLVHASDFLSEARLSCLSYFRVGIVRKLFVLSDSFSRLGVHHCCAKVFDVNVVEGVLR